MVEHIHNLSLKGRRRKALYQTLRDQLDYILINYHLIGSLNNYKENNEPYPFVDVKALRPGFKGDNIKDGDVPLHNHGLVIFYEDFLGPEHKIYLKFKDTNRVIKENLLADKLVDVEFANGFSIPKAHFDSKNLETVIGKLSELDNGLLIQGNPRSKSHENYVLTHFGVKVDWPIALAAESLSQYLGYLKGDITLVADDLMETLEKKLFEFYGYFYNVGGRRTAGVVVAQYLKLLNSSFTVYVGSSEARSLTKMTDSGTMRYCLVQIPDEHLQEFKERYKDFSSCYLIEDNIAIFRIIYNSNEWSKPEEGLKSGEIREITNNYIYYNWITRNIPTFCI